jgi:hypothetical protein
VETKIKEASEQSEQSTTKLQVVLDAMTDTNNVEIPQDAVSAMADTKEALKNWDDALAGVKTALNTTRAAFEALKDASRHVRSSNMEAAISTAETSAVQTTANADNAHPQPSKNKTVETTAEGIAEDDDSDADDPPSKTATQGSLECYSNSEGRYDQPGKSPGPTRFSCVPVHGYEPRFF